MTGLTHLFLKWSGLPARRIADIKLHFGGDLDKFNEIYGMLSRIAKQEMAAGRTHHQHSHCTEELDMELDDQHYQLTYYMDDDCEDSEVDFVYDEETDLHCRDFYAESGDWACGAYDSYWTWYEQEEIETSLGELDLAE
eukprot:2654124-Pyramimonas_sp.AAC.1